MDGGIIAGIGAAVVAVLGGLGTLYVTVMKARQDRQTTALKVRQEQQKTALDDARDIITRLDATVERQQKEIEGKQRSIDRLYRLHARCEARETSYYAWMRSAHAWMGRHCGGSDDVPPLPDPPQPAGAEAEFIERTSAHNAGLSGELARKDVEAARRAAKGGTGTGGAET